MGERKDVFDARLVSSTVVIITYFWGKSKGNGERKTGPSHLIFGTGSTNHVITSQFLKLCCIDAHYRPLENLDAMAL